jgi:hypothetical protein
VKDRSLITSPSTPDAQAVIEEALAGDVISLAQVARKLSAEDAGTTAPSTVWRWGTRGVRAPDGRTVRLEVARVGCRWVTSLAALKRFLLALNPTASRAPDPAPAADTAEATARRRQAEVEQAEADLRALRV